MIGKCLTMCPESEIQLRERENLLHAFEIDCTTPRHKAADYKKCVKEYSRPTVGKQDVDPASIRPPHVLVYTVDYLIDRITSLDAKWAEIYDFVFDRMRSIRQDLVIQDISGHEAVYVLEKAIRFHIYSDYRLCTEPISIFDSKINNQHTQECLKRLLTMYSSWQDSQTICCNQPEFEATYLLFNLGEMDAMKHFYSLPKTLRYHPSIHQAYKISSAYLNNNWVRLFREFKKLTCPIHLFAVHRHLPDIQRRALCAVNLAYSCKNMKFPLEKLKELLLLNTDTHLQKICAQHGVPVNGIWAQFNKSTFSEAVKIERAHCDFINTKLKKWTVPHLLHGTLSDLSLEFSEKCRT